MISVPIGVKIVVAAAPVDFRKGLDGLAALVQEALRRNPFSGDVFVFRAKRADRVKILVWDGTGLWLHHKRLETGRFVWPPVKNGVMALTPAQLAVLLEGLDWVRQVTDRRQRVKVPYDEGVANHIGPESCAGGREAVREALTGVRVGLPLSGVRLHIRSADALQSAEGNMFRRAFASAGWLRVVDRPRHARTSFDRELRGLRFASVSRTAGRVVKAESRRP